MKLAKYLADYIEHDADERREQRIYDIPNYANLIQQSIEAFESTEAVRVLVMDEENNLLDACKDFLDGWLHFCNCIDFDKSFLDAEAIRFMNEVPGKIEQAEKELSE